MQIICCDDITFPDLFEAWKNSKVVGTYWKNGNAQRVSVNQRFMFISPSDAPEKIAIKPARNLSDAEQMAVRFLHREKERGNPIDVAAK